MATPIHISPIQRGKGRAGSGRGALRGAGLGGGSAGSTGVGAGRATGRGAAGVRRRRTGSGSPARPERCSVGGGSNAGGGSTIGGAAAAIAGRAGSGCFTFRVGCLRGLTACFTVADAT